MKITKKASFISLICTISILAALVGCKTGLDQGSTYFLNDYIANPAYIDAIGTGEPAYIFHSVKDLIQGHLLIISSEVVGKGKVFGLGNGTITLGGNKTVDTNEYYVETQVRILRVIQGETSLVGETVVVIEHIGSDPKAANESVMAPTGKYLLFLNNDKRTDDSGVYIETVPFLTKYRITDEGKVQPMESNTYVADPLRDWLVGKSVDDVSRIVQSVK